MGLLLTINNSFIVKRARNGVFIFIEVNVFRVKNNVISFAVGSRTKQTLNQVIQTALLSNPKTIYTDGLLLYKLLIHKTIHKVTRFGTNRIERKNLSLRTHLKRLNRRSICFSKSLIILNAVLRIYFWL
jgi:IS1 family transposase